MIYLMYEKLRGHESFYHPYFDMVDSPLPTVYWEEEVLAQCDSSIMIDQFKDNKKLADEQWEKLNNFMAIYPDSFTPNRIDKDLFLWAMGFLNTRTFGWGLPTTMMVPLADCLNHSVDSEVIGDLFEKNLHQSMNKIYLYKHNWESKGVNEEDEDKAYDMTSSKISIACTKLFKEDEID